MDLVQRRVEAVNRLNQHPLSHTCAENMYRAGIVSITALHSSTFQAGLDRFGKRRPNKEVTLVARLLAEIGENKAAII